jgi:hypothetical protein
MPSLRSVSARFFAAVEPDTSAETLSPPIFHRFASHKKAIRPATKPRTTSFAGENE